MPALAFTAYVIWAYTLHLRGLTFGERSSSCVRKPGLAMEINESRALGVYTGSYSRRVKSIVSSHVSLSVSPSMSCSYRFYLLLPLSSYADCFADHPTVYPHIWTMSLLYMLAEYRWCCVDAALSCYCNNSVILLPFPRQHKWASRAWCYAINTIITQRHPSHHICPLNIVLMILPFSFLFLRPRSNFFFLTFWGWAPWCDTTCRWDIHHKTGGR